MVVLALVVAVLVVAWLTAAATAVRSVSRIWLRHWVERQLGGRGPSDAYLARPRRLVLAAGAGTAVTVALAGVVLGAAGAAAPARLALETVLLAAALLLLGQQLPRAIARHRATRLVPVLIPPLHAVAFVLSPALRAARAVGRAMGPRRRGRARTGRDGIEDLLREGELEGIGEPEEIEIIAGVVQFGEKTLRDVMTPRTNVFAVDVDMPPREMARAIARSGYSRVPVYRESLDEIVGMVHVFDLLESRGEAVPHLRPVAHAPGSRRCSEVLFEMLRSQRHVAVVLDEFGGTAGIVTLEDVLEELVGDIHDEHDEPLVPREPGSPPRAAVVDASTPLDEVERSIGAGAPNERNDRAQSVGGVLVRALGRIPAVGERFRLGELELTVVEAEPARVRRLLVQRAGPARPVELRTGR